VPAFWVKLGANDLNFVDVPLNPTHSLPPNWLGEGGPAEEKRGCVHDGEVNSGCITSLQANKKQIEKSLIVE